VYGQRSCQDKVSRKGCRIGVGANWMDIRAPEAMANLERVMERSLRQRIISSLEESDCQSCQGVSLCHGQA
jgi:hypothetical protein